MHQAVPPRGNRPGSGEAVGEFGPLVRRGYLSYLQGMIDVIRLVDVLLWFRTGSSYGSLDVPHTSVGEGSTLQGGI